MKVVKQPFFFIGIGAILCAIALAVVGTLVNPSSSLLSKYEKALNEEDEDLLEECYSPTLEKEELAMALLGLNAEALLELLDISDDDASYQILVGEEKKEDSVETEDGECEVTSVPMVFVIKDEDGEVVYMSSDDQKFIEIDGKKYFYTGLE